MVETPATPILLRNGRTVTFDDATGDADRTDILIEGSWITRVGPDLVAPAGTEEVDAEGMLVMPGMVDTHNHLWESLFRGRVSQAWGMEYFTNIPPLGSFLTAPDMYAGVYAGAVELLHNGVTSVLDYCHAIGSPEHADAAVQALRDCGIRARFGYDLAGRDPGGTRTLGPSQARFGDIERLRQTMPDGPATLVQLGVCLSGVNVDQLDTVAREVAFAREIGAHLTYHNNAGGEVVLLHRAGVLGPDILPAHCNYTTDEDLELLAACGGFISTQPEAEAYGGRRPYSMVGRAHRRGVRIALGVDVPALVNPGILSQARLLYLLQRYLDGAHERSEGQVPVARRPGWPQLSVRDVLRFATVDGAAALGWEEYAGRIAPGQQADLVLLDARTFGHAEGDPAAQVVMNSTFADVDTVLVGGVFRKRGGALVGVEVDRMRQDRLAARQRVLAAAGERGAGGMTRTWWNWAAG